MVAIAIALQNRLLEAAKRQFGPHGEALLHETAERALGVPLEQVTYAQLPQLLSALQREAPLRVGRDGAYALARDLERLQSEAAADLCDRLTDAAGKLLGPAAKPFLATVCSRLGLGLTTIDHTHLQQLVAAVKQDAGVFLGPDSAQALAAAIGEAGAATSSSMASRVIEVATAHFGQEGERMVRELCRERLETELDDLGCHGITVLAQAAERDGPAHIGPLRMAAFLAAAREAMVAPGSGLRRKLVELTTQQIGPAGAIFVKKACAKNGLPFEAVGYEHLMWLAEVLRREAAPLVGEHDADDLARAVHNLLDEGQ